MGDHDTINPNGSGRARIFAVAIMAVALSFAWFAIRWQIGDLFADGTSAGSQDAAKIAEAAVRMAPANPRGYWLSGAVLKTAFDDQSLAAAVDRYESAAKRSPNNYRSWTELGRVNEQAGRYEDAELAFRRATEIAPEYTIPRWQLGNFYLRRGRLPDAVTELNVAAKHNSPYRVQVFSTAWNVLGGDPRLVEEFLTDSADSKATLAYFYGMIDRPADAIRVWNMIGSDDKQRYRSQAATLAWKLLAHGSYRGALEFARQAGINPDSRPEVVTNGDFELPVGATKGALSFDWNLIRIDGKVDVAADTSMVHGGRRSLRFSMRGYAKPQFHALQQAIAVEPGLKYRLSFRVRTEDLRGGSLPFLEVRDAKNNGIIASSPAFASGTTNWEDIAIGFSVPPDRDGIYLITSREPCPDECPMTGIFWLDDISLSRVP